MGLRNIDLTFYETIKSETPKAYPNSTLNVGLSMLDDRFLITQGLIPRRLRRAIIPSRIVVRDDGQAGIQKSKLDAGRRSRDHRGSEPAPDLIRGPS
jgi:hypothetical protein